MQDKLSVHVRIHTDCGVDKYCRIAASSAESQHEWRLRQVFEPDHTVNGIWSDIRAKALQILLSSYSTHPRRGSRYAETYRKIETYVNASQDAMRPSTASYLNGLCVPLGQSLGLQLQKATHSLCHLTSGYMGRHSGSLHLSNPDSSCMHQPQLSTVGAQPLASAILQSSPKAQVW